MKHKSFPLEFCFNWNSPSPPLSFLKAGQGRGSGEGVAGAGEALAYREGTDTGGRCTESAGLKVGGVSVLRWDL